MPVFLHVSVVAIGGECLLPFFSSGEDPEWILHLRVHEFNGLFRVHYYAGSAFLQ